MGSILVVAKDVSRGKALAPNRRNVLPCTAKTSRQRSCNQRVGCLLFSLVRIYEEDRSKDMRKVFGSGLLW